MSGDTRTRPSQRRAIPKGARPSPRGPAEVGGATAVDLASPLAAVARAMEDRLTEQWLLSALLAGGESSAVVADRDTRVEAVYAELAALNQRLWGLVDVAAAP